MKIIRRLVFFAFAFLAQASTGWACLDITAYGGVGDGITPNDAAFSSTYAALGSGGGCISLPADGVYAFAAPIVRTLPNARFSFTLKGEGASTLRWLNPGGGITLTQSNLQNSFHFRDLSITTVQAAGSGSALHLIGLGANNGAPFQSDIQNVSINGADMAPGSGSQYWDKAIWLHNWASVDVANVVTRGPYGVPGTSGGGIGLVFEGDTPTQSYATVLNVARSSFNYHQHGWVLGDYWQGITCVVCNFNGAVGQSCILANGSAGWQVLLTLSASQFNCAGTQILIAGNVTDFTLTASTVTLYGNGNSGVFIGSASMDPIITGNTFNLWSAYTGTFCIASNGVNGIILGNVFRQCGTPANLMAASSNTGVSQNRSSATGANINNGTGNSLGAATQ